MPQTPSDVVWNDQKALKRWIPRDAVLVANMLVGRGLRFRGVFSDYAEASRASGGYDAQEVMQTAAAAERAVREGQVAAERDGVLLDHTPPPYPVLAGLAGSIRDNALKVFDFGGAFGSTYRLCRPWLGDIDLSWHVIEQTHYAELGRAEFETPDLAFHDNMAEAAQNGPPDAILFSGVLPYLPDPMSTIREALAFAPKTILIDRNPLLADGETIVTVQHVPSRIVKSSYPVTLMTRESLLEPFLTDYDLLGTFSALDGDVLALGRRIRFSGLVLRRRN